MPNFDLERDTWALDEFKDFVRLMQLRFDTDRLLAREANPLLQNNSRILDFVIVNRYRSLSKVGLKDRAEEAIVAWRDARGQLESRVAAREGAARL